MQRLVALVTLSAMLVAAAAAAGGGAGLYGSNSNVQVLNKSNFAREVLASRGVWLVEFYAPWCGHCKNLAPAWEAAATNLKGIVGVGAVNCDDERELCGMYGVQGFPTIKFFPSEQSDNPQQKGAPWKKAEDYQGQRSAAAIARFATDKLPNHVSLVTDKSHTVFLESKPELAHVLLFTDKKDVSSLYKAMALQFKDRLLFGQAQLSAKALAAQYGATKSPTLIVVPSSGDNVVYSGALKPADLSSFLETYATPLPKSKGSGESAKATPPPPPPEVEITEVRESVDQATFDELCLSKGVCGLAILDNSSDNADAATHEQHLATLLSLAKAKKKQARFTWVDGFKHPEVIKALDIGADYPQLVLLSPKKKGFAQYLGSFEEKQMGEFIDKVASGRKRMVPLDALPSLEA